MADKVKLSIVILSFNTRDLLKDCLNSLKKIRNEISFEVIVTDNGSTDGSLEMIKKGFPWITTIDNKENLGFARGNNAARGICKGKYILFLNSDTKVGGGVLNGSVEFLEKDSHVGALGCKLVLPNGVLDKDSRRRFPTPWISFKRLILSNGRAYWYQDIPDSKTYEVDVIQGAFFLTRKEILDSVNWFDEDYFLDGEDIDLCWKIRQKGWKIIYYPKVSITHVKGASKGKIERSFGRVTKEERTRFVSSGVDSMWIFYRKRLWGKYSIPINLIVFVGISLLRGLRYIKSLLK